MNKINWVLIILLIISIQVILLFNRTINVETINYANSLCYEHEGTMKYKINAICMMVICNDSTKFMFTTDYGFRPLCISTKDSP